MNYLVNAYFAKNVGDDLFMKILFSRYPNITWHLLTVRREYKEIFKELTNVRLIKGLSINLFNKRRIDLFSKVNNLFLKYRKFDGLLIIGGSIFMEGPDWQESLEKRKVLPRKLQALNKRLLIVGANFGPYSEKEFIEKHRRFFNCFNDICFRDRYSYNLFKNKHNVRVAPDVVFNLNK